MVFRVRADIKKATRSLKRQQQRQIPFAASNALNDVAFDVRKFTVEVNYRRSFPQAKNKTLPRTAFRVQKASKRRLRSAVFDRLDLSFFPLHITGRDKVPFRGGSLAIPTRNVRKTQAGRVSKPDRPANLKNSFVADRTGRGEAIWQRKGEGLRMMYVLKSSANIDKRFPFFRLGFAKARQVWGKHFDRRIKQALRTAR